MYGPGIAPPQPRRPSPAIRVVLRVVFVSLSLFSIGFLAWTALLRVAVVTRKKSDWGLFWGGVGTVVVACVFLAMDNTDAFSSWQGNTGMTLLLLSGMAATAYYLYADIRHYQDQQWPGPVGAAGYPVQPPQSAYGYPHLQSQPHHGPSPAGPTVPQHHSPLHAPPSHLAQHGPYAATRPSHDIPGPAHTPVPAPQANPSAPYPTPVPIAPAQSGPPSHGRIDQVRAELDELSDYLRRQSDEAPHPPTHPTGEGRGPDGGGGR